MDGGSLRDRRSKFKARKSILVVTQNKIMNLNMSMSPLNTVKKMDVLAQSDTSHKK